MSRYRGPRVKLMRALGLNLPGLSRKSIERRPYPPGAHGGDRRRKESDYGRQLKEKQKLRFNYGLGERQLRRLVIDARRSKTETGKKLLELLESRLDNVVFRGGLASTIPAARQLVNHAHVLVNGQKVDIPSFRVKVGDVITVRERSRKLHQGRPGEPGAAEARLAERDARRDEDRGGSVPGRLVRAVPHRGPARGRVLRPHDLAAGRRPPGRACSLRHRPACTSPGAPPWGGRRRVRALAVRAGVQGADSRRLSGRAGRMMRP